MSRLHFYRQKYSYSCGPTCLRIAMSYFGRHIQEWTILEKKPCFSNGWSVEDFSEAGRFFGLKVIVKELSEEDMDSVELPIVVLIDGHYMVLYKIKNIYYNLFKSDLEPHETNGVNA